MYLKLILLFGTCVWTLPWELLEFSSANTQHQSLLPFGLGWLCFTCGGSFHNKITRIFSLEMSWIPSEAAHCFLLVQHTSCSCYMCVCTARSPVLICVPFIRLTGNRLSHRLCQHPGRRCYSLTKPIDPLVIFISARTSLVQTPVCYAAKDSPRWEDEYSSRVLYGPQGSADAGYSAVGEAYYLTWMDEWMDGREGRTHMDEHMSFLACVVIEAWRQTE